MFLFAQGYKGFITEISQYNLGPSDNTAIKIMGGLHSSSVLFKQTARKREEKNEKKKTTTLHCKSGKLRLSKASMKQLCQSRSKFNWHAPSEALSELTVSAYPPTTWAGLPNHMASRKDEAICSSSAGWEPAHGAASLKSRTGDRVWKVWPQTYQSLSAEGNLLAEMCIARLQPPYLSHKYLP